MRPSNIEGIAKIIAADSRMKRNDFSEILDSSDINMTKVIMTSSIALAVSIPVLMLYTNSTLLKHPWAYRLLWGISFLTNLLTVQLPGRLDGEIANDGKNKAPLRFDTLFAPAGYAFAIWAVIYLGEILLSTTVAINGKPVDVIRKATPWWATANLMQSLWCASFRPRFINMLWLPSIMLSLGAFALLGAHNEFSFELQGMEWGWEKFILLLMRAPISLHAGWLCAASILNINGWLAASKFNMSTQLAFCIFSVYAAFLVGAIFSFRTGDPLIALTIAWALRAIAANTAPKDPKSKDIQKPEVPIIVREALATTEWCLAIALVVISVI